MLRETCNCRSGNSFEIVQHETFAPVLYLLKYSGTVENALELQNGVAQGLSSAIMTNNLREAEHFLSVAGSDCGIANVNIGTGAEIGGALVVKKKLVVDVSQVQMHGKYICVVKPIQLRNLLPLAQGIKFDL
jgi:aldehyde dehydrogenase (NAD+)